MTIAHEPTAGPCELCGAPAGTDCDPTCPDWTPPPGQTVEQAALALTFVLAHVLSEDEAADCATFGDTGNYVDHNAYLLQVVGEDAAFPPALNGQADLDFLNAVGDAVNARIANGALTGTTLPDTP